MVHTACQASFQGLVTWGRLNATGLPPWAGTPLEGQRRSTGVSEEGGGPQEPGRKAVAPGAAERKWGGRKWWVPELASRSSPDPAPEKGREAGFFLLLGREAETPRRQAGQKRVSLLLGRLPIPSRDVSCGWGSRAEGRGQGLTRGGRREGISEEQTLSNTRKSVGGRKWLFRTGKFQQREKQVREEMDE